MGARMVPANGQTTKTKKIFYMSFWLERLSILLQIYTFVCNFCSRKGGRASIGYRASIGTYTGITITPPLQLPFNMITPSYDHAVIIFARNIGRARLPQQKTFLCF